MKIQAEYREAVEEFVKRVEKKYQDQVESIILFGSVARGEAREESDIDILIVIKKENFILRPLFTGIAFDILLETGKNISVKVIPREDLQGRENFSFLKDVMADGVKIG